MSREFVFVRQTPLYLLIHALKERFLPGVVNNDQWICIKKSGHFILLKDTLLLPVDGHFSISIDHAGM